MASCRSTVLLYYLFGSSTTTSGISSGNSQVVSSVMGDRLFTLRIFASSRFAPFKRVKLGLKNPRFGLGLG